MVRIPSFNPVKSDDVLSTTTMPPVPPPTREPFLATESSVDRAPADPESPRSVSRSIECTGNMSTCERMKVRSGKFCSIEFTSRQRFFVGPLGDGGAERSMGLRWAGGVGRGRGRGGRRGRRREMGEGAGREGRIRLLMNYDEQKFGVEKNVRWYPPSKYTYSPTARRGGRISNYRSSDIRG